MLLSIATAAAILFLLAASIHDLKSGEIPDKITIGFTATILAISTLLYLTTSDADALIRPISVGTGYFLITYVLYHYGHWGGGDVKLLAGVGCALGLMDALGHGWNSPLFPYYLVYPINMGFLVLPYAMAYTLILGFSKPAVFKQFLRQLASIKAVTAILLSLAIPLLLYMHTKFTLFLLLSALMPSITLASLFLKTSEEILLTKTIDISELKESDALAEDLTYNGEKIALKREIEGVGGKLNMIKQLASEGKIPPKIRIRWGVKFAPIITLSFLTTVYFGDLMAMLAVGLNKP